MNTNTYNRTEVIAFLSEIWAEAEWKGVTKDELLWLVEIVGVLSAKHGRDMSSTLLRYRQQYEPTMAYSGRASLNNGDPIAEHFAGMSPLEVMQEAERLLGLDNGELVARYENLNPGQQRMNAGNRVRAAIKRGDLDLAKLH